MLTPQAVTSSPARTSSAKSPPARGCGRIGAPRGDSESSVVNDVLSRVRVGDPERAFELCDRFCPRQRGNTAWVRRRRADG